MAAEVQKTKVVGVEINPPSGLKITRTNNSFKFEWSPHKDYIKQQLRWRYKHGTTVTDWTEVSGVSETTKTKTVTLTLSNFGPRSNNGDLKWVQMAVRGKTFDWSDWSKKDYEFRAPAAPTIEESFDDQYSNRSTYSWDPGEDPANGPKYRTVLQTLKQQNAPESDTALDWPNAATTTVNSPDSTYYNEDDLAGKSWKRAVRVRAEGAGGASAWAYAHHVFAKPNAPLLEVQGVTYDSISHVFNISVTVRVPHDATTPVEQCSFQYCIGAPSANMGLPATPTWNEADSSVPKQGGNTLAAEISHTLTADECLWLSGVAKHDAEANWSYSAVELAYIGKLAAPTGLAITAQNNTTHKVDLSCTNNSTVPDSYIAIVWQPPENPAGGEIIGVIPAGSSSISGLQCPDWGSASTIGFRAYAVVGTATYTTGSDNVKHYKITEQMRSDEVTTGGGIPVAPATVTLSKTSPDVGIHVEWAWTWTDANAAEIAWSTRSNALTSTQQPDTFKVSNIYNPAFDIAGLTAGATYYVWVRLLKDDTAGPWSNPAVIYLAEAPAEPVLTLSDDIISAGGYTTASWTFVSLDGTAQAYAEVAEKISGVYYKLGDTETAQHLVISAREAGWQTGTTHDLAVRVTSESNQTSSWSEPVRLTIAEPLDCTITQSSLVIASGGYQLQALPLTVTVTGAGSSGQTTLIIRRAADFTQARPDETEFNGYDGEIIVRRTYTGEAQQTITAADILDGAHLDDTALYSIYAEVQDAYGQHAVDGVNFTVAWSHQAVAPTGSVQIVDTAAYITVTQPTGALNTDHVDIYRLSADNPELVYQGAEFGDVIVDPYPAIGDFGGYRLVLVTANGDYTTAAGGYAWTDIRTAFNPLSQLIDFGGITLHLTYNVEISSSWDKDFTVTKYLGGTQDGDWLSGVSKNGGINSVAIMENQSKDIGAFRLLAEYSGPVHIRTKDGSSYTANVNVSESQKYSSAGKLRELQLDIQRTRPEEPEGLTEAEWEASE